MWDKKRVNDIRDLCVVVFIRETATKRTGSTNASMGFFSFTLDWADALASQLATFCFLSFHREGRRKNWKLTCLLIAFLARKGC